MSTQQKKVLKKRTPKVTTPAVPAVAAATPMVEAVQAETEPEPETEVEESSNVETVIPSSRVSNFVSGVLLNKKFDDIIDQIKKDGWTSVEFSEEEKASINEKVASSVEKNKEIENQLAAVSSGQDLSTILSDKDKTAVGKTIKSLEEKGAENIDIREITKKMLSKRIVTHDTVATDIVSKKRFKFGKYAFDVLAQFGDIMINEITKYTLDRLVEVGNTTIEPKYVFSSKIEEAPLYGYYSQLPSFKSAMAEPSKKKKQRKQGEETTEEATETVEEETPETTAKINFRFYVKEIVYKHKGMCEAYSNTKVSERYQKFCSDLVLDMLTEMVSLSQIILQVMSTKTISAKLFKAAIFAKTYNLPGHEFVESTL